MPVPIAIRGKQEDYFEMRKSEHELIFGHLNFPSPYIIQDF